ncbi:unnamed protein product [Schistocephalus solidus]|uniref:C2H2-type domain-containing protein n=1 Tax=Schistocephalus solidus TaxID=70667 RepID=A0A183TDC0_SCHSO|nr:unnamed protein product [Schistocephalus solidus]
MPQPPPTAEYNAPESMSTAPNSTMWKPLPTWEAYCHTTRESMTSLLNGSPKPVRPSASCKPPCGFAMAKQDPGHGSPGADRNPQHPRHTEASAPAMERPPAIYEANRMAAAKAKRAARKSQASLINKANVQALPTCPHCQRTFRARIGLFGHLQTRCVNTPTRSASATPASEPATTTTPTANNHFIDAPQPTVTETILPPLLSAPNTTCPTPATSDYLPLATSNTTTIPAMGTWK